MEKRNIYLPTVDYYKSKYSVDPIDVIGLMIGARGTITSIFKDFCAKFKIPDSTIKAIAQIAVRGSIGILRNHLYN